ncbi:fructuronate reductase [Jatrophihabitans endophyticus]|uniref:Mannitol-1-phosphate 5-dehydrogenase n=1 Tax=Jatrophihabitans endophyticus TaxID=1206085 RepID=A0A1M5S7W3_9ACTN|nr:mannitol dehydrogenase family protein [Jatrophihabitans endophyticus]SHH34023.1 fructuronate reductase [Jatrophihabitans endophyticus]
MTRIVHLGLGSFHRAHQAVYTAAAGGDWSITGVAHRSRRVVDALRAQQLHYTVLTVDGERVEVEPVDVLDDALVAADEPDTVVARIADPATTVVTLTITEAGYTADGAMLALLRDGLARRRGAPITVISCDNLADNGGVLRGLLPGLDGVAFPSTMVDRIVPRTTDEHVRLAREAGFEDAVPVPAEPFRQWVLQPQFASAHPDWARAGVTLTDDVAAWEAVKVRLLNGTHSLLAYLGLLRGHELIADAIDDVVIRRAADALGDEYQATLRVPAGLDVTAYRAQLRRRFGNRALGHRTEQVGSDGSLKLVQRIPAPVRWHLDRGSVPPLLALSVAAFLRCRTPGVELAGSPGDPRAAEIAALIGRAHDERELARTAVTRLFGELGPSFADRVGDLLRALRTGGTDDAVAEALGTVRT